MCLYFSLLDLCHESLNQLARPLMEHVAVLASRGQILSSVDAHQSKKQLQCKSIFRIPIEGSHRRRSEKSRRSKDIDFIFKNLLIFTRHTRKENNMRYSSLMAHRKICLWIQMCWYLEIVWVVCLNLPVILSISDIINKSIGHAPVANVNFWTFQE